MALTLPDRLLTIAVTATIVSGAWIVFGSTLPGMGPEGDRAASEALGTQALADQAPENTAGSESRADAAEAASMAADSTAPDGAVNAGAPSPGAIDSPGTIPIPITGPESAPPANLVIPVLDISASELVDTFTSQASGGGELHEAIDIAAPAGTSVVSSAPGVIERLFSSAVGGNTIYVRSDDRRTIYYYAHLQEYAPGLRQGQKVRRGQRLGMVGSSGNADPLHPHLHFAILRTTPDARWWEPAAALNPYPLLTSPAGQ